MDETILHAAGLDARAIARLTILRERIVAGDCNELTLAHKHLEFVKHLVDSRRLDEERVG